MTKTKTRIIFVYATAAVVALLITLGQPIWLAALVGIAALVATFTLFRGK